MNKWAYMLFLLCHAAVFFCWIDIVFPQQLRFPTYKWNSYMYRFVSSGHWDVCCLLQNLPRCFRTAANCERSDTLPWDCLFFSQISYFHSAPDSLLPPRRLRLLVRSCYPLPVAIAFSSTPQPPQTLIINYPWEKQLKQGIWSNWIKSCISKAVYRRGHLSFLYTALATCAMPPLTLAPNGTHPLKGHDHLCFLSMRCMRRGFCDGTMRTFQQRFEAGIC